MRGSRGQSARGSRVAVTMISMTYVFHSYSSIDAIMCAKCSPNSKGTVKYTYTAGGFNIATDRSEQSVVIEHGFSPSQNINEISVKAALLTDA
jgi:hypothetical protein